MKIMWNSLDLENPISDVAEYQPQDSQILAKLRDFVTVLTTAADTLASDDPIWQEMNVLQNIQAKYKRILRCDKCLIYLKRVAHCLKKMVLLNLSKSYVDLAENFLIGFQDNNNVVHLPSRQRLEYVLIRTQTAAKLTSEAIRYSEETFCFLIKKLKVGHLILDLVMAASAIARLYKMLKTILGNLCTIYQNVFIWRFRIKEGGYQWLEKLSLPANLKNWLAATESNLKSTLPISNADVQFLVKVLKDKNDKNENDAASVTVVDLDSIIVENEDDIDFGEVVSRKTAVAKGNSLTLLQKSFLKQVLYASNFEKLFDIWEDVVKLKFNPLPITLTKKRERLLKKFLMKREVQSKESKKNLSSYMYITAKKLSKYLGFTQKQINMIRRNSEVLPHCTHPITKMKDLRALYKNLCKKMGSTNDAQKQKNLKKMFRRQIHNIKLLKKDKMKKAAKDMILCTSNAMLTLYEKYQQS